MKFIRKSDENEMILSFLKGELSSERFKEKLLKIISTNTSLITNSDIINKAENNLRYQILQKYRGYPNKELFFNFPKIKSWDFVELGSSDLDKIFYINYDYWNELSNNTSKPKEAAKIIREGKEIFGVSNEPYIKGLEKNNFPPVILITCNKEKYLIIEGHSRMTIYGLDPKKINKTYAFIGYCSVEDMAKYDKRMI